MAIAFARCEWVSRSKGGNVVRKASYNARSTIRDEALRNTFSFAHLGDPLHDEIMLPQGADPKLGDHAVLWNLVEATERRWDSQLAREMMLALPANRELTNEDRLALARSFAQEHFVSKGLAVQISLHAPHDGGDESEKANFHAHLLVTTRRIEGDRFSRLKARDLDPVIKSIAGRAKVTEGNLWGEIWRDHQNSYFVENSIAIRVDATNPFGQRHLGPVRMRRSGTDLLAEAEEIAAANAEAARNPDLVLKTLARNDATFSKRDVERFLARYIPEGEERDCIRAEVLEHRGLVELFDRETGRSTGLFTTKAVREQELAVLNDAAAVATAKHRAMGEATKAAALARRELRPDQQAAFNHAASEGGLKVIEGRAGTGKSYTLKAIAEAHEGAGYRVLALAPTNAVAQNLKDDGFAEPGTVHSEIFRLKNGRSAWNSKTLVLIDEAAMLGTGILGQVLAEARASGAKILLAGDDRQLASIERGGLFTEIRERHGSAEVTGITRQKIDWQRQAAQDLSEGRFLEAVKAFDENGGISWGKDLDEARAALVQRWSEDSARDPEASRFVFAYTNKDVDLLNAALRQARKDRGELGGNDHVFTTKHGEAAFTLGDRIQFTDTLKPLGIFNGNAGTLIAIDPRRGILRARLDGAEGREVEWNAAEFIGFRHGYAGTIYKGQGRTLDHTYLLHTKHWRANASYVALTRQRESARIFVARDTAPSVKVLARQIGRNATKLASIAFATAEELPRKVNQTTAGATATPRFADDPIVRERLAQALESGVVAAVIAADPSVRKARKRLDREIETLFRDPEGARKRLEEVIGQDGFTSASQRMASTPAGVFKSLDGQPVDEESRIEMARDLSVAIRWRGEVEAKTERAYRSAIGSLLGLSPKSRTLLEGLLEAGSDGERAEFWEKIHDRNVTAQIDRILRASGAIQRFRGPLPPEAEAGVNAVRIAAAAVRSTRKALAQQAVGTRGQQQGLG